MVIKSDFTRTKKSSSEVPEYIENLLLILRKLHLRVFRAQENLNNIMDKLYTWAMMPILYRKDAKDENLLSIDRRQRREFPRKVYRDRGDCCGTQTNFKGKL